MMQTGLLPPQNLESGGLHRTWVGRRSKKVVPGGEEEEQKHRDLCMYNLGKGEWLQVARV